MTSKERVVAAAERKRTDRPPTGLRCTSEAWKSLREYLGVESDDDVLDALDVDLRWIDIPFIGPRDRSAFPLMSEGTDFWGCHYRKAVNDFNTYYEIDYHPLREAETIQDIENHNWPELDWWEYSAVKQQINSANRRESRAILYFAGNVFETAWYMRGFDTFFIDLYEKTDVVRSICSYVQSYYYNRALHVLEAGEDQIDIIGSGGDLGGQRGMLIDPDLWRKTIKPYTSELIVPFMKKGLKTFYHSCGSIVPVIGDFIEMGLHFLDPVQVTAYGMTPEELFTAFGNRLSFHGAIDEVDLLTHASAGQVYQETRRVIDIMGGNHGFIVAPSHRVQGDTPPENVVAVFEAARNYRWK